MKKVRKKGEVGCEGKFLSVQMHFERPILGAFFGHGVKIGEAWYIEKESGEKRD